MDIMELGAIGELVGGVAVVASLIFVGVQVRQNTKTLRQAGRRQASLQNQKSTHAFAEYAELTADGFDRLDEMSVADRWRFDLVWTIYLQGMEQTVADEREGLQTPEYVEPYRNVVRAMLALPGGRQWWDERKSWSTASFQKEVERIGERAAEVEPGDFLSSHYRTGA